MNYFYFNPNVHHANINNEVTILDEISDRYIFLSEKQTEMLTDYMKHGADNQLGNHLSQAGIISKHPNSPLSNSRSSPQGAGLLMWNSSAAKDSHPARLLYAPESVIRLMIVRRRLKAIGLHGCLETCRRKLTRSYLHQPSEARKKIIAEILSDSIKTAAPFLTGKVKCLEFSLTLFDMLICRNIKPALFIGFQRYDFLSHAWIEIDDKVISDDQELKNKLTPIISVI